MQSEQCLIGRQPILNRNEEIVFYELLFRSGSSRSQARVVDGTRATAAVITDTLSRFGLQEILGQHRGFINMDLDLLMSDLLGILPRQLVVLELLETLEATPELVERCRQLKADGFTLALDDHVYDPAYKDLYDLVDVVKVDLQQSPLASMDSELEHYRHYPIKLLAEKVETRNDFLRCRDLGFEYFQGYYFAKPAVIGKKRIDDSGATLLKLMRLLAEDANVGEVERVFNSSPGLTYKLLLLVNSVSLGMRRQIRTVRHAIAILGRQQIKRWVQLALFASNDERGLANPLVDMAAVRAALMEQLARRDPALSREPGSADSAFMVGILSLLESIYSISIAEVVTSLNLSSDIGAALTTKSGPLGRLLDLAQSMERSDFRADADEITKYGFSLDDLLDAQIKAYLWLGSMT